MGRVTIFVSRPGCLLAEADDNVVIIITIIAVHISRSERGMRKARSIFYWDDLQEMRIIKIKGTRGREQQ